MKERKGKSRVRVAQLEPRAVRVVMLLLVAGMLVCSGMSYGCGIPCEPEEEGLLDCSGSDIVQCNDGLWETMEECWDYCMANVEGTTSATCEVDALKTNATCVCEYSRHVTY